MSGTASSSQSPASSVRSRSSSSETTDEDHGRALVPPGDAGAGVDDTPDDGAEGLKLLWQAEAGYEGAKEWLQDFDIVVVHGFHASRRWPWENLGSGSSEWVDQLEREAGRAVLVFGWDPPRLLAGTRTSEAIHCVSQRLLDDLKQHRASQDKPRPIMFVAHDIGGMIVKSALTFAGLHPSRYGEIFDYARVIIFYGCPHNSFDELDMQDRLSRFLLSHHDDAAPELTNTVAATQGLTRAVIDINNFFMDSKHFYRSHIISVSSNNDPVERCAVDKAFDDHSAFLRIPFETRVHDHGGLPQLLRGILDSADIKSQIVPDPSTIEQERKLLSTARPISVLTTIHQIYGGPYAWLRHNDTYKTWFSARMPQILYLHGSSGVREAAEYMFYDLDHRLRTRKSFNEVVLYFTFDQSDIRYDTTADMLTTFLAQIICHNPTLSEHVVNQFERLAADRSWSDYDLLSWFQYYRLRGQVEGVTCVINHFEQCEEGSRKAFLDLVSELSKMQERPWSIVVTSRERGALSDELSEWPSIDLDLARPSTESEDEDKGTFVRHECEDQLRKRPELKGSKALEEQLQVIADLEDPAVRELVLAQVGQNNLWPEKSSVEAILGPVSECSLDSVLDRVMALVPDKDLGLRALSWITHSIRPLTVQELGTALYVGGESDDGKSLLPNASFVQQVVEKILTWFAGLVHLDQHEIRVKSPRIRELLRRGQQGGSWGGVPDGEAERIIVQSCLDLLSRDEAREYMEDIYGEGKDDIMTCTTLGDRSNLCTYAVLYWPTHLSRVPSHLDPGGLLSDFTGSQSVSIWTKAYWSLADPIQRSPEPFVSLYPILAGIGLADVAEPLCNGTEDISAALAEACLNGLPDIVHDFLGRTTHSVKAMQEALVAAGSYGDGEIWMDVIQHVKQNYEGFEWPSSLLSRAAWLGLDKIICELLDLGSDPNPADMIQNSSPLHLAARNGHVEAATVLLERGADKHHRGQFGRNAVQVATAFAQAELVKLLVEKTGVDINAKDEDDATALYSGTLWGNCGAVETLLSLGADPDLGCDPPGEPQWNPLVVAAEEGYVACVRALLAAGADPNYRGPSGTPVRYAVIKWRREVVKMLADKGADLNHPSIDPPLLVQAMSFELPDQAADGARLDMVKLLTEKGARIDVNDGLRTPLMLAAEDFARPLEIIPLTTYLLDRGADINEQLVFNEEGIDTALTTAVRTDNYDLIKLLIESGAAVNPRKDDGKRIVWSALHYAVSRNNIQVMRLLLENGADVNHETPELASPLITAVRYNAREAAQELLEHNVNLDAQDVTYPGWTAITFAAAWGFGDIVQILADAGADINQTLPNGRSLVHLALSESSLPCILEYRPDVDVVDEDGQTPLHFVRSMTPVENVKLLVRAGAKIDVQDHKGVTPLIEAIRGAAWETASYLLAKYSPAAINISSPSFGSALHQACLEANLDIVKALVEKGADVNQLASEEYGTPLQFSILSHTHALDTDSVPAIVEYLIHAGADVRQVGGNFGTAVAVAALQGPATLLTTLLEKGVNPSIPDDMGRLPIHFASSHGADPFRIISDAVGDDALVRDKVGRTVLHWAAQGGHVSVVERILQAAGDGVIDQPDVDGWTALCWAARGSEMHFQTGDQDQRIDMVKLLIEKGANIAIDCSLSGRTWNPVDIARYHWNEWHLYQDGVHEVLELLELPAENTKAAGRSEDRDQRERSIDGDEGEETEEEHNQEKRPLGLRLALHGLAYCDYCLSTLHGMLYKCDRCPDFCLCYKCHNSHTLFHPTEHAFFEKGEEFQPSSTGTRTSSDGGTSVEVSDSNEAQDDASNEASGSEDEDGSDYYDGSE